jgi:hypothetical protein
MKISPRFWLAQMLGGEPAAGWDNPGYYFDIPEK